MLYIGADHGGFELKEKLVEWLMDSKIEVEDVGEQVKDAEDDFVDYAMDVAEMILDDRTQMLDAESKGIVICRNGVGVDIVANRYPGVRCVLGFDEKQVKMARNDDDVNCLALPADYIDFDKAKKLIEVFLNTEFSAEPRFIRRLTKIEAMTDDSCGDSCSDGKCGGGCGDKCEGGCEGGCDNCDGSCQSGTC